MLPARTLRTSRLLSVGLLTAATATVSSAQHHASIEEQAGAILQENCISCHGAAQMSGLDMRTREALLKGGTRGPAISAGNAEESLLYQVLVGTGELRMPMGGDPLPLEMASVIRKWIDEGARWESGAEMAAEPDWWAFKKPVRSPVPSVQDQAWSANPIDAFVWAKLTARGLKPVKQADKRTLIRRAYFDLYGLPPSPEAVDEFLADDSQDAFVQLVDRLLDSPRYGERYGRHWLDVVRYADTGGFETDIYFPNAWRYRDYVIKSFNQDKPFDRFIQEQIAGDELWPDDIELRGGFQIPEEKQQHLEARIGTGLYTIGPVYHEAALNGEQLRYEWMVDAVDTTGEAFLGVTITCARCHDHKFDPLSKVDYHRMMAVFAGSEARQIPVTNKMGEFGYYSAYTRIVKVQEYQEAIGRIDRNAKTRAVDEIKERFPPEEQAAFDVPKNDRTPEQLKLATRIEQTLSAAGLSENATGYKAELPYTPNEKDDRERLIYELGKAASEAMFELPSATVLGHSEKRYPVHMSSRGDWRQKGEVMQAGLPAVLPGGGALDEEAPESRKLVLNRRTALAKWLTEPDHPLTGRVVVNRIWQWHFGRGIVATPNNFGRNGEPPTHPDLLDWLTGDFIEHGWSVKRLHRQIMISKAYQLSSAFDEENAAIDPGNHYLWRMNRRRLEAETVRDAVLAVAGALNLKEGGRPVVPPLTEEEKTGLWAQDQWPESLDPEEHNRRSVYLHAKRSFPFPMFTTFDAPDSSTSCGRREVTTVAPQALTLLNSEFMLARAHDLAARLARETNAPSGAITRAWQLALARPPTEGEVKKALEFFSGSDEADDSGRDSLVKLSLTLLNMNEFLYVD